MKRRLGCIYEPQRYSRDSFFIKNEKERRMGHPALRQLVIRQSGTQELRGNQDLCEAIEEIDRVGGKGGANFGHLFA